MKLKKIMFKEHDILGDLVIDFNDANGKVLNTVAFIGENGSGKSVILKELANQIDNIVQNKENDKIILEMYEGETLNNGANLVYFPDRVEYDERLCSNEETAEKIEKLRDLVREDKYDSEEFDELYEILRVYLGNLDIDLNLIDMEVKRRMNKRK